MRASGTQLLVILDLSGFGAPPPASFIPHTPSFVLKRKLQLGLCPLMANYF